MISMETKFVMHCTNGRCRRTACHDSQHDCPLADSSELGSCVAMAMRYRTAIYAATDAQRRPSWVKARATD